MLKDNLKRLEIKREAASNNLEELSKKSPEEWSKIPTPEAGSSSELPYTDEVGKAMIGGFFLTFVVGYRELLSVLSSEQLSIIVNISGSFMILNFASTLVFIVLGDELIYYFNLESKYPRLARYIRYKKTYINSILKSI
jgi:hypothetical protein